ncbi:hypothetical protein [Dyadobacter sp. CY323]|uniref:hypothetical protein n=1 Tax=Dyadobacter sp. CY323 TaxID=2907302 RepID=UPI001F311755|nr:hypothetical protein [Dyadobacter sp. CY323]MCE6992034.1 hypothetical protein [Dyadobacter sp. CY323]
MRVAFAFLIFMVSLNASGQVTIVSGNNFNFVNGVYSKKSIDKERLEATGSIIEPQTEIAANAEDFAFLFTPKTGILLFESKNLNNPEGIAGKLLANSIVRIDTVFHNQAYRTQGQPEFTFDMVYALKINGKMYYTDFRPHDFVPFRYALKDHRQRFLLAAQSTGYDMYADKGYPNHFHVAIFSEQGKTMHLHYVSEELPFDFENEFWEDTSVKYDYNSATKELHFEMEGEPHYKAIWNGTKLKRSDL